MHNLGQEASTNIRQATMMLMRMMSGDVTQEPKHASQVAGACIPSAAFIGRV